MKKPSKGLKVEHRDIQFNPYLGKIEYFSKPDQKQEDALTRIPNDLLTSRRKGKVGEGKQAEGAGGVQGKVKRRTLHLRQYQANSALRANWQEQGMPSLNRGCWSLQPRNKDSCCPTECSPNPKSTWRGRYKMCPVRSSIWCPTNSSRTFLKGNWILPNRPVVKSGSTTLAMNSTWLPSQPGIIKIYDHFLI